MDGIYLDSNATTRPLDEVVVAMNEALRDLWHNPSSTHRPGQAARARLESDRVSVATLLGADPSEVVMTSGGTEADNLAIYGSLAAQPERRVVVTCGTEHSAVREPAQNLEGQGADVVWLRVLPSGLVDLDHLDDVLGARADEIALVSIMWVNNETGVMQPIEEIGRRCHEHGVRLHTDGVQTAGKMPLDVHALPIDLLACSAHKFHGPKGAGALFVRKGLRLGQTMVGGSQERHRRGGTENIVGVAGIGAAARAATAWLDGEGTSGVQARHRRFEEGLKTRLGTRVEFNGAEAPRLWTASNVAFPGLEAEAMLLMLSERGICAAAGAACASGSLDPSPVLLAMGMTEDRALSSIRFSFSRETTDAEIDAALVTIADVVDRLQPA